MATALVCPNCHTLLDAPTCPDDAAVLCPKCAASVPLPATLVCLTSVSEAPGTKPGVPLAWAPDDDGPLESKEKSYAMLAHLGGLLANFFLAPFGFAPPLIVLLVWGKESRYVAHHAKEAINYQITMAVLSLLLGLLLGGLVAGAIVAGFLVEATEMKVVFFSVAGGGVLLSAFLEVYCIFMAVLASIKSYHGEWFRYPFCARLVK